MLIYKIIWLFLMQLALNKGEIFSNSTQNVSLTIEKTLPKILNETKNSTGVTSPPIAKEVHNVTLRDPIPNHVNVTNNTYEIYEIFHEESKDKKIIEGTTEFIETNLNLTSISDWTLNETFKTNCSVVVEPVASSNDVSTFGLQNTAAIAAGVCLVSGAIGYLSCVGYRRYLQKKYGDKEMLDPEDFYDTSDLRYFEI